MCLESSPSQPGSQETWVLGLACCGTGQVQSHSVPQFLLQTTQAPGLDTKVPFISDLCVALKLDTRPRGPKVDYRLEFSSLAPRPGQGHTASRGHSHCCTVTQKRKTLCGPLLSPIPSPGILCSKYLQLVTMSCSCWPGSCGQPYLWLFPASGPLTTGLLGKSWCLGLV